LAPGDDAHLLAVGHQRTAGVTLAGVLLLAGGADHGLHDRFRSVFVGTAGAVLVVQQVDGHLEQGVRGGAEEEALGAPAGDDGTGTGNGLRALQFDGPDLAGLANRGAQLHDGHIVELQLAVVALVELEGPHADHLTAGAPGLGSQANLQLVGGIRLHAVGGGQDGLRVDQAAATEVGALGRLDGHLVGEALDLGVLAVDDPSEGEVDVRVSLAAGTQGDQRHHTQYQTIHFQSDQ